MYIYIYIQINISIYILGLTAGHKAILEPRAMVTYRKVIALLWSVFLAISRFRGGEIQ